MEVMVRNLPDSITEKQITKYFHGTLEKLGIATFHCQKLGKRGCATITILDIGKARQFVKLHGQKLPGRQGFSTVQQKLFYLKQPVNCSESTNTPDIYLLRSLKKQESDRYAETRSQKPKIVPGRSEGSTTRGQRGIRRGFGTSSLSCGQWTYAVSRLTFFAHYSEQGPSRIIFGRRGVTIKLMAQGQALEMREIVIPYHSIHSFTLGPHSNPSVTFSLTEAPRFFRPVANSPLDVNGLGLNGGDALADALRRLSVTKQTPSFKRKRITALSRAHEILVSNCLCYRFELSNAFDISALRALKVFPEIPASFSWNTSIIEQAPFAAQMTELNSALTGAIYGHLPFELKFQMQRLAQNGSLPPSKVVALLPSIASLLKSTKNLASVVDSVRSLCGSLPFPGPDTEASAFNLEALTERIVQSQNLIQRGESYSNTLAEEYDHIASIHKATVTPAGIYLYGPEPEVKNRVLRKYSAFTSHFLSVSFLDEDGETLRLDRQTSGIDIYHGRFKKVLKGIINIAGRGYEFLGFSHSSLRAQTCWFMAPFTLDGALIFAPSVIKDLGDFSMIRSPAKCAARIGQAFSQTFSSITIPATALLRIPDVVRNHRTFSDGVGTCSSAVVQKIHEKYTQARGLKPTVFQIRFQGAKGMISLDNRLKGSALRLRPSMIKFEVSNKVAEIEICGSALKPLPMYLNRQLIKILEDLSVPEKGFLDLQAEAVEKLRITTESPVNAASFFQRNFIGKAAMLPWLIRKLWAIGRSFSEDAFLRSTLEISVLMQLRELKHRSRIPVEKAETLYGIMDETDVLQEGEIYCTMQKEGQDIVLKGGVVITRCPALHPGDVQVVTAVDIDPSSPLRALHNVVVFSSRGKRDLPSMLSGGDLDGDLYNIIYDDRLFPKRLAVPASYANPTPIDIGRPVERTDITEFFINFMENDILGLIATLHQILADQKELGTFDADCLLLAAMHSTAVDFSKTGIPVNSQKLPKYPRARPDFQAPGPRVLVTKTINFEEANQSESPDDDPELDEIESHGPPRVVYYQSEKILGKLYREIDEHVFFEEIQSRSARNNGKTDSLPKAVWSYIQEKTALIQWNHYIEFARDIRDCYEENLADTMLTYSHHPAHFITEVEVFAGSILGRDGAQSKRQREASVSMKEKHERDVAYTVMCIRQGESNTAEALERSIACLYVAVSQARPRKRVGTLVSFMWIAAAVCLKEVEKLPGSNLIS